MALLYRRDVAMRQKDRKRGRMTKKPRVVLYSLAGALVGTAIAIAIPIWPIFFADIGSRGPLWLTFDGFYGAPSSLADYLNPLMVTVVLVVAGQSYGRKLAGYLHRRAIRRRMMRGCCAACGYNLAGNTSGVCPECGECVRPGFR